jgi:hypothetical protein
MIPLKSAVLTPEIPISYFNIKILSSLLLIIEATEVLGRWEKKRKKEYPGARP